MNTTSPSTEDRFWAVLSHLSALAFGMGILLPIIGWSEQRRRSKYASFQCLQALGYQSLGYTLWLLFYLVMIILLVVVSAFVASAAGTDQRLLRAWIGIFVFIALGLFGIYMAIPIVASVACGMGKDFRYPIIGNRLAKYLGYQQTNEESLWLVEEHEDRWVAAMGHFSVIIVLWGLIAPATAWMVQGKRSLFLKFQSMQTALYQAAVNLLYLVAMGVIFLGALAIIIMTSLESAVNENSSTGMLGLVLFFIAMLIGTVILLVLPLFHILGQWAGYRVLKGDDYRYPLVGRLVENWMAKNSALKDKTS